MGLAAAAAAAAVGDGSRSPPRDIVGGIEGAAEVACGCGGGGAEADEVEEDEGREDDEADVLVSEGSCCCRRC